MKKIVLTIACAFAVTGAAFAQGTLAWNAISPAAMTTRTNTTTFSPLFTGFGSPVGGTSGSTANAETGGAPNFYYELLYTGFSGSQLATPTTLSSLATWSDTGLEATNATTVAGFIVPMAGSAAASVNGWANGTTNSIMLVGWSADFAALDAGANTWNNVSNILANWTSTYMAIAATTGLQYFFGESATGYINPNLAPAGGATLFNTSATANGLPINSVNTPLYLLPVPEPTTIALAGLGGLSLLLFRRRKV